MTSEPSKSEKAISLAAEEMRLLADLTELKRAEERSRSLIDCLLSMGADTETNINSLAALCGKTMGAACCLFNRVNHGLLCSVGQWQPPTGFKTSDKPDGHICYDVIKRADDKPFVIRNLPATDYVRSDPNVAAYGLQTYVGLAVKCHGRAVGSLCVVYQDDVEPSAEQLDFMCLLGFSIASEEERQRADSTLHESAKLHRDILSTDMDGYWMADMQGSLLEINAAVCRMSGYSEAELLSMHISDLDYSGTDAEMTARIKKIKAQGDDRFESKLRRKDGSCLDVEVSVHYLPANGGRCVAFYRDITERKRAEEVMRESESRFRNLLQDIPAVAVQGYGPDGTTQYWNQASERLYGYSTQEAIGRNLVDLIIPPEMREYVISAIRQMAETGHAIPASEVSLMRKDGSRVSVFSSHVVVQVPGRQQELFCVDIDLTERKAAEESLRQSEEKFRAIANYTVDFESWFGPDGKFLWVNPAVEEITGYAADEVLAMPDFIPVLIAEEDRDLFTARFKEAQSGSRGADFEFRGLRKNGSRYWLSVAWQPIFDSEGKSLGFRVSGRDVTARKRAEAERVRLEEQLRQAQKMESVGRLAGGVAHDFNNMLSVILGHVELAVEEVETSHPVYAALVEIDKAARRSADLTRQLLAFGRKQTIAPKVLDLNATVEGMLKMLERLIGEDIHLVWQPKAELLPVKVDPSQIDQILANLCVNARDAIGGVGKLTIETDTRVFGEDDCATHAEMVPGEYVLLAVSDSGCGMDRETLEHLFEPFFTTKETGKGTGLGLATVYGIVKQNRGVIDVYSERGQGTTFKIYLLRYAGEDGLARVENAVMSSPRGHETILLVEDEQAILKMTADMLVKQGYTVLAANAPDEALRLAHAFSGTIHLLLTDVVMPGMNGRELARNLQASRPNSKCLFMSGYTEDVIAHHGVLDPGMHFIQKPVSLRAIAVKVRDVLDNGGSEMSTHEI